MHIDVNGPRLWVDLNGPVAAPDEISAHHDRPPRRGPRRWRRFAEPLLLLAAVATALAVTRVAEHRSAAWPREPAPAAFASPPAASAQAVADQAVADQAVADPPRFVVPLIATPGEQITVVAYRDGGLCGPTTVHMDQTLIPHQVRASAPPSTDGFVELYVTLTIPPTASPGIHRLKLGGPVPGRQAGNLCGGASERQGDLAEAEIIVLPDNAVAAA